MQNVVNVSGIKVLAVRLVADIQTIFMGNLPHLAFGKIPERQHYFRQLLLLQAIKKIALVLFFINGATQLITLQLFIIRKTGIVSGGEFVKNKALLGGAQRQGRKLNGCVADNARVRRATGEIFRLKIVQNELLILFGTVNDAIGNIQLLAQGARFFDIFFFMRRKTGIFMRRYIIMFGFVPDGHRCTDDFVPLLFQDTGNGGGINASAHSDKYFHFSSSLM